MGNTIDGPAKVICLNDTEWNKAKQRLSAFKNLERFNGINGYTMKPQEVRKILTQKAYNGVYYQSHRSSDYDLGSLGAVGCYLSHLKLWQEIVDKNLPGMYIFESDVICTGFPSEEELQEFRSQPNPHFLAFGTYYSAGHAQKGLKHINKLGRFMGMHAYYITNEGARKLIKDAYPIEQQIDAYISDKNLAGEYNAFVTKRMQCMQDGSPTTIQTKKVLPTQVPR